MSLSVQSARNQGPIRCLVIQLSSLGDSLQSLMALRAAKQLYPNLEIHFVVRENFASAAMRVDWLSKVITLPTSQILAPDLQGLREISRWVAPLTEQPWDVILNWSYSEASSFLTGLLPARIKLGYSRHRDTSFSCTDGWSHYVQAVVQGGIRQNIHLTDILTTQLLTALQIHVGDPATDGNAPVTSKNFFNLDFGNTDQEWNRRDSSRRWIAIQLGAGWDPEAWAKVAGHIVRRHPEYRFALLGGAEDLPRSKRFVAEFQKQKQDPKHVLSLVGESDFDLLASVVGGCHWLFSENAPAVHLASVLGTRVLNISTGQDRWSENGPYGNGHYVISAKSGSDKEAITPEAVYSTWSYAANEWSHRRQFPLNQHFEQLGWSEHLDSICVHRSKIRGTGEGGGVYYEPMVQRRLELEEWTAIVMDQVARGWYCGWIPPVGQELKREMISPKLVQQLRELEESIEVFSKICKQATKYSTALGEKSCGLKSEKVMSITDRQELQGLGANLMELDQLIARLGKAQLPLQAFARMSAVLMHNLAGFKLTELGRESAVSYRQLGDGVAIMGEWLQFTLNLAKPIALKNETKSKTKSAPGTEISPSS